ncbi:MAG: tyrosine--tRNA ligase [Candidatus Saccharimonadales bacterium]
MTLSEELTWRGFVNQTTYTDITALDNEPITFYFGVDPSADSLQIGNLAAAMMVKCFIKHGHKAVLLVGGATGLIGDPDGKRDERSLKLPEEITANKQAIVNQYKQLFDGEQFEIVDNYDWFKDVNYLDFLREVGKHVPMRQMLGRDFVQSRLGEGGSGISYAEFSYVLIQAYDFLRLYQEKSVRLQLCGSDQWGNSIAGVDLIRRAAGGEAHVFSTPLIVNKATGQKFGKSEAGAIWLGAHKTTPYQFYQFWLNVDDDGVESYLKVFTELDKPAIEEIMITFNEQRGNRHAQKTLAYEVTKLVHGQEQADKQVRIAEAIATQDLSSLSDTEIATLRQEITTLKVQKDASIVDVLVDTQLAASKTEAHRLLEGNAISINGQKITRAHFEADDFQAGRLLLRRGKAFKDSALIELG